MTNPNQRPRVLVVGRSPGVLLDAVRILREKGYAVDATNQFDRVLADYDPAEIDLVVFGGMVPPATKHSLREEFAAGNDAVVFVQGLAGIAGVIAAQVEEVTAAGVDEILYDLEERVLRLDLGVPAQAVIDAWWGTFTPPEPTSATLRVFDGVLDRGRHAIELPAEIPAEASFLAVAVGASVRTFTVGPMPESVVRLVGTTLPPVDAVNTRGSAS